MNADDSSEQAFLRLIEDGVSASAERLAEISRTSWKTQTVSIRTAPIERFATAMSADEHEHCAAFFSMPGGVFVVMFPRKSGSALANAFLPGSDKRSDPIPQREQESMAEISNIMVHAVANALADACDEALFLSSPEIVCGKKEDLLKEAPKKFKSAGDNFTVMAYVHMSSSSLSSDCTVLLLLNAAWRARLLKALE